MNKTRSSDYHLRYNLANLQRSFPYLRCFQDLVLYPLVQENTGPAHYFIEEVSSELTASTVMDGLGMSLGEYYRVHHEINIKRRHQKLIRISSANKELHMLQPGGEPVADGKKRTYRSFKGRNLKSEFILSLWENHCIVLCWQLIKDGCYQDLVGFRRPSR